MLTHPGDECNRGWWSAIWTSSRVVGDSNTDIGYVFTSSSACHIIIATIWFTSNSSNNLVIGLLKSSSSTTITNADARDCIFNAWTGDQYADIKGSVSVTGIFENTTYVHLIARGNLKDISHMQFNIIEIG